MRKKYILTGVTLAVIGFSVYFLAFRPESAARGGAGGFEAPPAVVMAASAEQGSFSVQAEFVGTLKALSTAELYAKVSGPITRLYVETGDPVKAGQVLAQIDDSEARERVRQMEAALKIAAATLAQREAAVHVARTEAQRVQTLYDKKLISDQEYEARQADLISAEAQHRVADAQVDQARANLSTARLQLDHTRIVAPFNGYVGRRHLDLGAFATANRPVFVVVDVSVIKMSISLIDKDAMRVRPGQPVAITSDAAPGESFPARVARISPIFDPGTGTAEAEIEITNRDARLRPGMLARATIAYETEPTALLVPKAAVVASERGTHLFVAEQQGDSAWTAREVSVRVLGTSGDQGSGLVAVEGTVDAGDRVVTLGQESLRDGARIRVSNSLGAATPPPAATPAPAVRN